VPFLTEIDLLLLMTVEPGFGGQSFMEDMLAKSGIAPETASRCRAAGAEVFVAGHAIFRQADARSALGQLHAAVIS
jgi:ribulose-phosphate 3-epimerase